MGKEIERKFLVTSEEYKEGATSTFIRQGFLNTDPIRVVRIRIVNELAWLTIKSKSVGTTRAEFEYPIPLEEAAELLKLCIQPVIEKKRYKIKFRDHTWEIDEFTGENLGLVLAEVELSAEDELFAHPNWIGKEVTDDSRYYNNNLILNPFSRWKTDD